MALKIEDGTPVPLADPADLLTDDIPTIQCLYQKQSNWCWAAVLVMILRHTGNAAVDQCDLATGLFGGACCAAPGSGVCNQGATAVQQQTLLTGYGRSATLTGRITFAAIRQEITARRPVALGLQNSGGGHRVLVRGWDETTDQKVLVCDPQVQAAGVLWYADLQPVHGWYTTLTGIH